MGKNLLVIGASSDMAMGTIRQIHADYDRVIAHYRRMNDTLASLKAELGDKLVLLQADLSDENAVQCLIEGIHSSGGSFPYPALSGNSDSDKKVSQDTVESV